MTFKNNLYICRSPLQLLNCIEACEEFGKDGALNVLFCAWRSTADRKLLQHLLNLYPNWSEVHFFPLYPTRNQISPLIRIFNKNRKFTNLFVGDTTHLINIFINKIGKFKSIYIIDDGSATLTLAKRIANTSLHRTNKSNTQRSALKTALQAHMGLSPMFMYQAKFFTFYPIHETIPPEKIVKNDLKFCKSRTQEKARSREIWFIGSNIRQIALERKEDYNDFLAQVNRQIDLSKVIYIPHRKESDQDLKEISNKFKMEIRRLENILEIELVHASTLPESFISFGSSALDTIDILSKSPITVFRLPEQSIRSQLRSAYRDMYESMLKKGFNFIDLLP